MRKIIALCIENTKEFSRGNTIYLSVTVELIVVIVLFAYTKQAPDKHFTG
jgi:hypothetical protein